ncbi:hypothetical protein [Legionella nagasakiensis]|uniref:hypothetical protein n=1 Tax=Legionella nagasakiensis TaxID=535290 RepID=UPI001054E345|nr:hypothetical protein [Legionella nagasakiensis]
MDVIINAQHTVVPEPSIRLTEHGHFYHHLLSCLNYSDKYPPVADLLGRYYGLEGRWLVVSPVHWEATHNDAMMIATSHELHLSEEESRQWFSAFAEFSAEERMQAYYCDAHTWLLRYDDKPEIIAKPAHSLLHQSLLPHLQALDETFYWQRFITESQMFFNTHPLNDKRPDCSINGLWLWGSGRLNTSVCIPVICGDSYLIEIANHLSSDVRLYQPSQSLPKNAILLIDCLDANELHHLQVQLCHTTVHWYWNNGVYCTRPKKWLSRLWGSISYAN